MTSRLLEDVWLKTILLLNDVHYDMMVIVEAYSVALQVFKWLSVLGQLRCFTTVQIAITDLCICCRFICLISQRDVGFTLSWLRTDQFNNVMLMKRLHVTEPPSGLHSLQILTHWKKEYLSPRTLSNLVQFLKPCSCWSRNIFVTYLYYHVIGSWQNNLFL